MRFICLTLSTLILLVGCSAHGPSIDVTPARVDIDMPTVRVGDHHHHGGKGTHCPPGQAKKGRC